VKETGIGHVKTKELPSFGPKPKIAPDDKLPDSTTQTEEQAQENVSIATSHERALMISQFITYFKATIQNSQSKKDAKASEVTTSPISNSDVDKDAQSTSIPIQSDENPAGSPEPQSVKTTESPNSTKNGILAKKLRQLQIQPENAENHNSDDVSIPSISDITKVDGPDYNLMDLLRTDAITDKVTAGDVGSRGHEVRYTPLISGMILDQFGGSLLPQYGYLGDLNESDGPSSRLFLNTNTPFSAMVFGVQGSGKSHTASCLLGKTFLIRQGVRHLMDQRGENTDVLSSSLFTTNNANHLNTT
jgi:hypothetical protein